MAHQILTVGILHLLLVVAADVHATHSGTRHASEKAEKRTEHADLAKWPLQSSENRVGGEVRETAQGRKHAAEEQHRGRDEELAYLKQQAESAVMKAEAFAAGLEQVLHIEKIARVPSKNARYAVRNQSELFDKELRKLEHIVNSSDSKFTSKAARAAASRAKETIRVLAGQQEQELRQETAKVSEEAEEAARGAQNAAREAAREAREKAGEYARYADSSDEYDFADSLSRRAEAAAAAAERNGEELSRRVTEALRDNLDMALQRAREEENERRRAVATVMGDSTVGLLNVTRGSPSFASVGFLGAHSLTVGPYASIAFSLALVTLGCIGVVVPVARLLRRSSVQFPPQSLG